ncbi:MlaD family protein [Paraconexibacter antarcticus]|uniref:MlaD family protein n=1 Tax=Paraconexibacter antarcticus TaxID=2949664 RepID=A0ABY5DXW1_9ACTN|nr:MlaD family protein [Paraconexibacter antarcticus]UTI66860.1 MlaD family protein [Paraconexibacter antarcticus]
MLAAIVFVWLMGRFGGPSVSVGGSSYRVHVTVPDTEGLAKKSDVLTRGVKVGEVSAINIHGRTADIALSMLPRYRPIPAAARVRVGQKTLLGEAYVELTPPRRPGPSVPDGGRLAASSITDAVELDEALSAVGARARPAVRSSLGTFARGARSPVTSERLSATLGRLDGLTGQLRNLTSTLHGQSRTVAALVTDARPVLGELGDRQRQITDIVTAGRQTLAALGQRRTDLQTGLEQVPRTLVVARRSLVTLRPLLVEARPLLSDLRRAAPALTLALNDLRPVSTDAATVLARIGRLRRSADPVLKLAGPVIAEARPVARRLDPTLANLVPIVDYLEPRKKVLAAWFSQTAAFSQQGDAKGKFVRFGIFVDPATASSGNGSSQGNAYPAPGDQASNAPYARGSYPQLRAYMP